MCGDQTPVTPRKPLAAGHARFSIAPTFKPLPPGVPVPKLATIKGRLIDADGHVVTNVEAKFDGDSAVLTFETPITGLSATFRLEYDAFDIDGVLAYQGAQDVVLKPGDNPVPPPQLIYAAPDAALAVFHVSPRAVALKSGGTAGLGVSGANNAGQPIPLIRVAWTSKDPAIATVDASGIVLAGPSQGATFIVARTATELADSAVVTVSAPVDRIVVTPSTLDVARGTSGAVAAELRDAGNHLITDRTVSWATSDASIATVSSTGGIQGVRVGSATITASVEGKTGSGTVRVVSPVDHIELTPGSLTFASLQETKTLGVRIVPRTGASVDGLSAALSSSNSDVASVTGAGVVTAMSNGGATITASVDGFTATAGVTVKQVATAVTVTPKSASTQSLGESQTFRAAALDALGYSLPPVAFTWTSSNPAVASVGSDGTATAKSRGTVSISATLDGISDAGTLVVAQNPRLMVPASDANKIIVGGAAANLTARLFDARGNDMGPVVPAWTTSTPSLLSISGSKATGLAPGLGRLTASAVSLTASLSIFVEAAPGTATLTVTPATVEKLPNGTQQFSVAGGSGPFTWTVNGVEGGSSTYGVISSSGFYIAPAAVPSTATFDVCATQASPSGTGCAHVTIQPVPTSGADVIVFNDINLFDATGAGTAGNQRMFRNLFTFTGTGPRASATVALIHRGHNSRCGAFPGDGECSTVAFAQFETQLRNAGATVIDVDDPSATFSSPIAANVKVVFLLMPVIAYTNGEINVLKQFAAEGGRIVFVGEWAGYYPPGGIATENAFFQSMGAQMTNSGGAFDCSFAQVDATHLRVHQVTDQVSGLTYACASAVIPGPNDYAFFFSVDGSRVLGAVAKIDVTPLSNTNIRPRTAPLLERRPTVQSDVTRDTNDSRGRPLPP